MALFIIFYDHNNFLMALILVLLLILAYNNSVFHGYFWQVVEITGDTKAIERAGEFMTKKNPYIVEELVCKKSRKDKEAFLEEF